MPPNKAIMSVNLEHSKRQLNFHNSSESSAAAGWYWNSGNQAWNNNKNNGNGVFVASGNSRKGMFDRYHGHNVAKRWYEHQSESLRENIKMSSNHKFINKNKPRKKQTELIEM